MNSPIAPRLLVVEDEPEIVVTIDRLLRRAWPLRVAETFQEALAAIESGERFAGVILDVALPDGSGLNLLPLLRDVYPTVRILVLTAHSEAELINRAQLAGAEFAVKPHYADNVRAFAARIREDAQSGQGGHLDTSIADLAQRHQLNARETRIVELAVARLSRDEMAAILNVSVNTLKTETKNLLYKCRSQNLVELAGRIRLGADPDA